MRKEINIYIVLQKERQRRRKTERERAREGKQRDRVNDVEREHVHKGVIVRDRRTERKKPQKLSIL